MSEAEHMTLRDVGVKYSEKVVIKRSGLAPCKEAGI